MKNTLNLENYYSELKSLGVNELPKKPSNLNDLLKQEINKLNNQEESTFYVKNDVYNRIFIVSNRNVIELGDEYLSVMDDKCNPMFYFSYEVFSDNYKLSDKNFEYLSYIKNKENKTKLLLKHEGLSSEIQMEIEKNVVKIHNAPINLTSLTFESDKIIATFKGTSYAKITLDYNYKIQEVEIAKNLIQKLELDSTIKYYDVNNYEDLMNKIKKSLGDKLDFYSLVNDYNHKFKGTEERFNRDLEYIKEITKEKENIFSVNNEKREYLQKASEYYKEYLALLMLTVPSEYFEARFSKETKKSIKEINKENIFFEKYNIDESIDYESYDTAEKLKNEVKRYRNLTFLNHYKNNKISFFNYDIIDLCKDINSEAENIMKFNTEAIKLKKTKNKI